MEHDAYDVRTGDAVGDCVEVELQNSEVSSRGYGLVKRLRLSQGEARIEVCYVLPELLDAISVDFALSPDYLNLLRHGRELLKPVVIPEGRGWGANSTAVWIREEKDACLSWCEPFPNEAGHKATFRATSSRRNFSVSIGVNR